VGTAIPQEGTTSNRYTILGRLAGGGMADIFIARAYSEGGVERHVVLKRVLPERGRDPQFVRMFLDEARLAAQLHHPNIAQVHDIGKLAGSHFFTMEYVHGEDLRALMQRVVALGRQLPIHHALHVAAGTLAGLHHAHERCGSDGTPLGVVHRDVSPSNVMVSYEGVIKLLDFGVAKAAQRTAETHSGTIKGKIGYLSPEQAQGGDVDRRSDIFALGVVLHEMLTGQRLFRRDTDFAAMIAIVNEDVAAPSSLRPEISPELDQIVLTALAKDPAKRFATAADMLEKIEDIAVRERHVMSATAMGRFLRELFGERPEPWIELASSGRDSQVVTITSEALSDAKSAPNAPRGLVPVQPADLDENVIETQLHATPALWRAEPSPRPDSVPTLPASMAAPTVSLRVPDPQLAAAPPPIAPAPPIVPAAPVLPSPPILPTQRPVVAAHSLATLPGVPPPPSFGALRYPQALFQPEPTASVRKPAIPRAVVIAIVAGLTIGVAIAIVKLSGSAHERAVALDAAVAVAPPRAAEVHAAPTDAAAVALAPDAATPAPSLADRVAAKDWTGALALCRARKPDELSADDRTSCGVAACNSRQRALALSYAHGAGADAIERACREHGISLAPAKHAPVHPASPDCEREPLKCQK